MTGLERLRLATNDPDLIPIPIAAQPIPEHARAAAVLILLTDSANPKVTLIERSASLRTHAGQIAFPGGGLDPDDDSASAAALRETEEEIGLPRAQVQLIGQLPTAWVPVSGYAVTPVLGTWDGLHPVRPIHPEEVSAVLSLSLTELANPQNRVSSRHVSGYIGPAFVIADLFIWGFTAHLISWVLELGGWTHEWDATQVLDVPERFLRDR